MSFAAAGVARERDERNTELFGALADLIDAFAEKRTDHSRDVVFFNQAIQCFYGLIRLLAAIFNNECVTAVALLRFENMKRELDRLQAPHSVSRELAANRKEHADLGAIQLGLIGHRCEQGLSLSSVGAIRILGEQSAEMIFGLSVIAERKFSRA